MGAIVTLPLTGTMIVNPDGGIGGDPNDPIRPAVAFQPGIHGGWRAIAFDWDAETVTIEIEPPKQIPSIEIIDDTGALTGSYHPEETDEDYNIRLTNYNTLISILTTSSMDALRMGGPRLKRVIL